MPKTKAKISKKNKSKQSITKKTRRLQPPTYKSFRLRKKIKPTTTPLRSAFKILFQAMVTLRTHWRLFLTITVIYGVLTVILVHGLGGSLNLTGLKNELKSGFSGRWSSLLTGVTLFSYLLGSAGTSVNPAGGVYQTILVIIISLVTIWALRQVVAGSNIRARDAFYKGLYPLVPFILVLLVVGLQLIPLLLGSWLYATVVTNSIAITAFEKFVWAVLAFLLVLLSLYMVCSSIFALYIVTLPDMTPMKALRSARQLVRYRRWTVVRRLLFLPVALLILGAVIMIPLIIFLTPLAEWVFFFLTMFMLVVFNTYMYTLYRELL